MVLSYRHVSCEGRLRVPFGSAFEWTAFNRCSVNVFNVLSIIRASTLGGKNYRNIARLREPS